MYSTEVTYVFVFHQVAAVDASVALAAVVAAAACAGAVVVAESSRTELAHSQLGLAPRPFEVGVD